MLQKNKYSKSVVIIFNATQIRLMLPPEGNEQIKLCNLTPISKGVMREDVFPESNKKLPKMLSLSSLNTDLGRFYLVQIKKKSFSRKLYLKFILL